MPRVKDDTASTVDPEAGFAALEAKVEEVQLDAAIEAELAIEDAAEAKTVTMLQQAPGVDEQSQPEPANTAKVAGPLGAMGGPSAPFNAVFEAMTACAESAMRLQGETLASFSRVKNPGDLLAAQMAFSKQALELYTGNMGRLMRAVPSFAR